MILSAPINVSSNGDNSLISGDPTKIIRVLSFMLVGGGSVNATFKSKPASGGQTSLTGPIPLAAGTVVTSPPPVWIPGGLQGQFECVQGEGLNLNLSAGTQVSGYVTYIKVTA